MTTEGQRPERDYSQFSPVELSTELKSAINLIPRFNFMNDVIGTAQARFPDTSPSEDDIDLVNNLMNNSNPDLRRYVDHYKSLHGVNIIDYEGYLTIAAQFRKENSELQPLLYQKVVEIMNYSVISAPLQELLLSDLSNYARPGGTIYMSIVGIEYTFALNSKTGGIFDPDRAKDQERRLIKAYLQKSYGSRSDSDTTRLTDKAIEEFRTKYHEEP